MSVFEKRVQINQIIENSLPEFIISEFPKTSEFLKQYYISQEYQGGPTDIAENLDQYLKLDNLTSEIIVGSTRLLYNISSTSDTIQVASTKGFPKEYGLLKIDDEIITYTGISGNTFIGCIRGFSGVTGYSGVATVTNQKSLIFSTSKSAAHESNASVQNLSSLFLKEFYRKLKFYLTPGLEDVDFYSGLNVSNFIKEARSFYQSKGTAESFRILFNVLYGENALVADLETRLIKPSSAEFLRREVIVAEKISGEDPSQLVGQTIYKSTDINTKASVSEVEPITRDGKVYYKISLFIGYDERDLIEGTFTIPGKTKVLETVSVGSSIISVDSTIGFGQTGTLISGNNTNILYQTKTINQFLGCSNIFYQINQTDEIRSDEVIYGYGNSNPENKIELRITGVLSKFKTASDIYLVDEKEKISVKNLGDYIKNPQTKTYKEIFANSWIYNTSSRYFVSDIFGSTFRLQSTIDKSSLALGDTVQILLRGSNTIVVDNAVVAAINNATNEVTLNNIISFVPNSSLEYDIRRKLKKSTSSNIPLKYGNNKLLSDTLNVYTQNEEYGYVASNSLPSYQIQTNLVQSSISEARDPFISGYSNQTGRYSIISFTSNVSFIDGDKVVYEASLNVIPGLISGRSYYIKLLTPSSIRLYESKSQLNSSQYVEFDILSPGSGSHTFTLEKHKSKSLSSKNLLRKFPFNRNFSSIQSRDSRLIGPIGVLVNGVEIVSPESQDKIYYGPLEKFEVINSGKNYDVINPPNITISSPSVGTTAIVNPVISGIVSAVYVDPQDFDVQKVISLTLTGGNGTGCVLEPVMGERFREIEFDSRDIFFGGGLDPTDETITFINNHNLKNGEAIIYNQNGNTPIGISTFKNSNVATSTLVSGSSYYVKSINPRTIQIYNKLSDYNLGINTIGIASATTSSGIHKFRTVSKNTLRSIKVLNPGSGYENRSLRVKSSGISTYYDTIEFKNHGFKNGDIVEYQTTGTPISGLSTTNQYYILNVDNDHFRLARAGIAGSITSTDFDRFKYVNLSTRGSGDHIFKYPDIKVSIVVSYGSTITGDFSITPVVTGKIVDAYLYESGTGYGSEILNLEKKPTISLKNGKGAEIKPIIANGSIIDAQVLNGGSEYFSTPDLEVVGNGSGALLRPVVTNQKITDVVVIQSGIGYSAANTSIYVKPKGSGALFDVRVRGLTVNDQYRFGEEYLSEENDTLSYNIIGYSEDLGRNYFSDTGSGHSPIIGWAYDGNPIYGPYGYSIPSDNTSSIKILNPGYTLSAENIADRPPSLSPGFLIEDYKFDDSGDLDFSNGRFCKTPEFPNGTYAYFVGVQRNPTTTKLIPRYPYFVGNTFKLPFLQENKTLNQTFNFNDSGLVRNTFPYKTQDKYANNDFIVESNEIFKQYSSVESVTKGSVDSLEVIEGGDGYKVNDYTIFDDSGTNGYGVKSIVSHITGKNIEKIETSYEKYENSIFVWNNDQSITVYQSNYNTLNNNDSVIISGLSSSILGLSGVFNVGVSTETVSLFKAVPANVVPSGVIEDIYVSKIPQSISIGSSIKIDDEIVTILNAYPEGSILRVKRHSVGSAHTLGALVTVLNNRFNITSKSPYFDSQINEKVYFNGVQSVGMGTTSGLQIDTAHTVGEITKNISIPTQSIYLPNHPFKTGQKLFLTKTPSSSSFIVGNNPSGTTFNLPDTVSQTSEVYIINKSNNFIGLTTQVGLTTNTNGLYFYSNGSNNSEYLLTSNFRQVTGTVDRLVSKITTTTAHGLKNNDEISLNVVPNVSVGIGSTTPVRLKYNQEYARLLVNPIGFSSAAINTTTNKITIFNHGFENGEKVFYTSLDTIASGLTTGFYFVDRIDSNNISLSETYFDTQQDFPNIVDIIGIGGSMHQLSKINPPITVTRGNDLVFDVTDSSLAGSKLKFFTDQKFINEFISTQESSSFNVTGIGTIGVVGLGTTASVTLKYSDKLPSKLYYSLERSGYISTSDVEVKDYSSIIYENSHYQGEYKVYGITTNTFNFSLSKIPESFSYTQQNCDILKYATTSESVSGPIERLKILSGGLNYKKLPKFVSVNSADGQNANIKANSKDIGRIKNVRILDIGYEYASDKTLRPEAFVSPSVYLNGSDKVEKINVIFGGLNYISPPNLILYNPTSKKIVNTTSLSAKVPNTTISSVDLVAPIYGLETTGHQVIAINNSNGVGISSITSGLSGVVTCTLTTPFTGFSTNIFKAGDEIYVEGIENATPGTGFNSSDYEYKFFTVSLYENTNPAKLEFSVSGLTTNPGVAKTFQAGYASIVNRRHYPVFEVLQDRTIFEKGEQIYVNNGRGFFEKDVYILDSRKEYVKLEGTYVDDLAAGNIIRGKRSGAIGTINKIVSNKAFFEINYSSRQDYGWNNETGKLSEDYQVIPDNDYYQNLSYAVKSSITYDKMVDPVNRLLHPAGMKNFSDTSITSNVGINTLYSSKTNDLVILDILEEKRVDSINNYDLTVDFDSRTDKSKYLKFTTRKLTDYTKCKTNRVLVIDDISSRFSSKGFEDGFVDILTLDNNFERYLVQVRNPDNLKTEVIEIIVLTTEKDVISLEKSSVSTSGERMGTVDAQIDSFLRKSLRFTPEDPYYSDHDIKVLRTYFNTDTLGIGTNSFGSVRLSGSNISVAVGLAQSICSYPISTFKSLLANVQIQDELTKKLNYAEILLDYDGRDTHLAEYYFDDVSTFSSQNNIGIITASVNTSDNTVSLGFINNTSNRVSIRSNIIGILTETSGIGTYRFKSFGQDDGSERSCRLESLNNVGINTISVCSLNKNNDASVKSFVRVSCGNTSALHQILVVQNTLDSAITQYPFVSVGSTSGIGTFGVVSIGNTVTVNFYPDLQYTAPVTVQAYNEVFYTINDFDNYVAPLEYGSVNQELLLSSYDGINGNRANKVDFDLNYQGTPIYVKTFNPFSTSQLNKETGIITIPNHFYNTAEELIYTPTSTFIGVGASSIGIGVTMDYSGIVTNRLPGYVYPIVLNANQIRLSTRKEYAQSGIYVTFTDTGNGNAHKLEMTKKLERSIISLDGIVQQPITYTSNRHYLYGNIGAATSYIALSGISTIQPNDLFKIDNEIVKINIVGFGSTPSGPIRSLTSFPVGIDTYPLVQVNRGSVGTAATSHLNGSVAQVYRGSFNIVGSKVYFTAPPKGNTRSRRDLSNLPYVKAEFDGRTFLRSDYTTNTIFDDISDQFTGIGKTYSLKVLGANTTGVSIGNGILFINGVFQTPTTINNSGNNYTFIQNSGISSVIFSGITSANGTQVESLFDINQNQLPRGGIIVSLGSTPGLGYAPLVGASVTAVLDGGGSIVAVGIGSTDIIGSGYNGVVSVGVTQYTGHTGSAANITATVGAGGTLSFNILSGGSGYTNPQISVSDPVYENLPVTGVFRRGVGATTETGKNMLLTVDVGPASTTGIGSTLHQVKSFKISRPGYGFQVGDVIRPVGLVTARGLNNPLENFELTVESVFNDYFSAWQFGELDYIDSIKNLQNGSRTRFPLYYNGQLLSFETDPADPISSSIDLSAVLIIFVNGVLQKPNVAYQFTGGTSFVFSEPPSSSAKIDIFFYIGDRNVDITLVDVNETIKIGDRVFVYKNPSNQQTLSQESYRTLFDIAGSDFVETDTYVGPGIDEVNLKPTEWEKQKVDKVIKGDIIYKSRETIEPQIYPSAKVIKNITNSSTDIFVDDAQFFNYEENNYGITINTFDALVLPGFDPVGAAFTATVGTGGTISRITITNPGYGYSTSSLPIRISSPKNIGIGIGTTATASVSIVNGSVASVNIDNPGFGYTTPPYIISETPAYSKELVKSISNVQGFSGIITGITTSTGVGGHPLALKFFYTADVLTADDLVVGYPVYITDTKIGSGVVSVDTGDSSIVGIGTTFLDNIYYVHAETNVSDKGFIICNVASNSNVIGINTTSYSVGFGTVPLGRFSWGRLYNLSRSSSPISIGVTGLVVDSGLTTFPTIQRRAYGLRNTGAIRYVV